MTLKEVKDQYAVEKYGVGWESLVEMPNEDVDEVSVRYAKSKLEEAAEKIENRYAVALVFRRDERTRGVVMLRSFTTDAISKEEALGKALEFFAGETEGYALAMKTVIYANAKDSITETPLD